MQTSNDFNNERQDFRILVAPIGALLLLFVLCYPVTSYLELPPDTTIAGVPPEESGWHLGIVPLWHYDRYSLANWHPANALILLGLVTLWGACLYLARRI